MRIALDTLGCKLNQAETELLARRFTEAGYRVVSSAAEADIYILNTCTVTHITDRKARHLLRLAHQRSPDALVVATGCYAERAPQELAHIDGVDLVLGNEHKSHLLHLLEKSGYLSHPTHDKEDSVNNSRTRTFVKVQDGCNSFCSYCIVPLVRGRERSVSYEQVINEIKHRVADGYKEVVLTGTEIGSYTHNGIMLKGLLERILADTDVVRLRLSSIQPQEISSELIALWRDNRLCPHFHLSLQSGSDNVLRRMRRRYSAGDYQQAVSLIRAAMPEAAITTDIIVSFPGETEVEFQDSFNFCQKMEFTRIHVFPYSPRQGTSGAQMPQQVDARAKKERSQKMLALADTSARNFRQRFLGKTMPVLWEQQSNGIWSGYTDNYIKVYARSGEDLNNRHLTVKLVKVYWDGVWGRL